MGQETPRRERKKAQTRKALLDAALRLIAERGIYGTRVEDITERSDVGKGAFYNYFPSKNALVAALVARGVEVLCADYLTDSSEDRVAAVIRGHEAFFNAEPVFVVLFHQARGLAKIGSDREDLERVFADYLLRIGDLLVAPANRDPASVEHRMDLAAIILGSISGYRSFRVAAGMRVDPSTLTGALSTGIPRALARDGRASPDAR